MSIGTEKDSTFSATTEEVMKNSSTNCHATSFNIGAAAISASFFRHPFGFPYSFDPLWISILESLFD